eukprot:CAMPEP_0117543380 /NCGR_PEP_ID=MMETSP0784-20121206/45033_1 /TAXON_ID=39447 /ORGANISM="" /LENGTH=120 /DNA_ID=CAMNT_0005340161 /DNA_START=86 /DNA_END=448 /DNA_ORIENTATION=+
MSVQWNCCGLRQEKSDTEDCSRIEPPTYSLMQWYDSGIDSKTLVGESSEQPLACARPKLENKPTLTAWYEDAGSTSCGTDRSEVFSVTANEPTLGEHTLTPANVSTRRTKYYSLASRDRS